MSQEQVCHGTNTTLGVVERCPENDTMVQESSKKKMCEKYPKCLGEPLVYHCVRTKDNLVEVCAPSDPIVGVWLPPCINALSLSSLIKSKLCNKCTENRVNFPRVIFFRSSKLEKGFAYT